MTGSFSCDLKLWNKSDWKELDAVQNVGKLHVTFLAWSPDSTRIAVCHRNNEVSLWKVDRTKMKLEFEHRLDREFCEAVAWWSQNVIVIAPKLKPILNPQTQKEEKRGSEELVLFNVDTKQVEERCELKPPSNIVVMKKEGKYLGVGRENGSILLFDLTKKLFQCTHQITPRKARIKALTFSSDGTKLKNHAQYYPFINLFFGIDY